MQELTSKECLAIVDKEPQLKDGVPHMIQVADSGLVFIDRQLVGYLDRRKEAGALPDSPDE